MGRSAAMVLTIRQWRKFVVRITLKYHAEMLVLVGEMVGKLEVIYFQTRKERAWAVPCSFAAIIGESGRL